MLGDVGAVVVVPSAVVTCEGIREVRRRRREQRDQQGGGHGTTRR
jgi:hypothetical protein